MPPSAVPKTSSKQRKTQERIRKQAKPVYMHSDNDIDKWKTSWVSVLLCMQNADIVPSMLCIPVRDSRLFILRQHCFTICMLREPHSQVHWWIHKWMGRLTDWLINFFNGIPIEWLWDYLKIRLIIHSPLLNQVQWFWIKNQNNTQ